MSRRRARSRRVALAAAAFVVAANGWASSLDEGVALHVRETFGIDRVADPVTFGVPLPLKNGVTSVDELAVLDAGGSVVPAQLRATTRWNGAPDDESRPIRWLLVDLQIDVAPLGETTYSLVRRDPSTPAPSAPPLQVITTDATASVDTGAARFELGGSRMTLFDEARVDLDGDGAIGEGERLIDASPDDGFTLEDRFGALYRTAEHDHTVTLEEAGPLRAVVRIDGRHAPADASEGIGRDFFQYRTRVLFYAGKSYARVVHTLRNAYLADPLGSIGFEGYALDVTLADPTNLAATLGTEHGGTATFAGAGAISLYQDSDGGPNWSEAPNTTFQGYKIRDGAGVALHAGDQAGGFIHVGNGATGVTVAMRMFYENFPKGFAFDGTSRLRFDLFPSETASWFWLDDGQQKTTDFLVHAHGMGSDDPALAAVRFRSPLQPYCDAAWIRMTGAWGDQGDLYDPGQTAAELLPFEDAQLQFVYDDAFNRQSYGYGWSDFGELIWAKNTHTSGSPRNKLSYFDRFAITGALSAFRVAELHALHSRDLRTYHIDGFSKESNPYAVLWEGLPPWKLSADKLGRDQLDPALDPHRTGIPVDGHEWNGCDFEHMVVDDLYEHYLRTGDGVTLDSLKEIGECARTWLIYDKGEPPGPTRGVGWTLRALIKIYQATGDARFLESADELLVALNKNYNKKPSKKTGKVYHYVFAHPPVSTHVDDAPFDMPWQLAVTVHGLLLHHRETGSKKSRKIALRIADYLVKWCWNGKTMHEAVAVDDHKNFNPKSTNEGVNIWIPSALALAHREKGKKKYLVVAKKMVKSLPTTFTKWDHFLGWSVYHWWHSYYAVLDS